MFSSILFSVYVTGMVITAIVLYASEFDDSGYHDADGKTPTFVLLLFIALWPLFLIGLGYDSFRTWRAQHKNHDPDEY